MRQLRDGAGLGPAELAARAHYPYDRIKAAEVGPTLPDLPVLSAYVRGCGGTSEEWEERWRSLTSAPTLPLVDARPAGCSTAASAGARIGSVSPVADTPDPSVILAALDRVAEQMAVGPPAPLPSRSGVSTIEQRPGIAPAAAKPAAGKAGAVKVTAWETTTIRTAWSSASGPAAPEVGQPTSTGPGTTAKAGTGSAENVRAVAAQAGSAEASAASTPATSLQAESGGAGAFGGPTGIKPAAGAAAAADASAMAAAAGPAVSGSGAVGSGAVGPAVVGRGSRGSGALSRTTIVALIAIAICVFVALLATVA